MKREMRVADLAKMTRPQQDAKLRELVATARQPPNGELAEVKAEVENFERAHGFDSATMQRKLRAGELAETLDVCQWLMAIHRRERIAQRASRSR